MQNQYSQAPLYRHSFNMDTLLLRTVAFVPGSRADMCLNCSLFVKSMKFGMIVFKALKKIGYGAIAKKSFKCEK